MERLHKVIFWCHLPVGVVAGIIVLIMSVTGVLLAYERQITAWADSRNCREVLATQDGMRLPVQSLLAKVNEILPDAAPSSLTLRSDPVGPAAVSFAGGRVIFVNPYNGEVLGEGSKGVRDFFRTITDWHRWLGAHGENRAVARTVTGVCNLGFLFLVVSGFYLWWPRKWTWSQIRKVIWFRRGLPGKARDFNWHNVVGFWSAIPLFIVVLSAVVISFTWASNLVYAIVGETPPAPRGAASQTTGNAVIQPGDLDGLNQGWARAEQQIDGWQSISLRLPSSADENLAFTIDQGNGGQPHKRAQLTVNRKSSEVVRWEPFSSYTTGRKTRTLLRFAHTGEAAGIVGQTIAGLASVSGAVLVCTGLALAWRRFRAWIVRMRSSNPINTAPQLAGNDGQQTIQK